MGFPWLYLGPLAFLEIIFGFSQFLNFPLPLPHAPPRYFFLRSLPDLLFIPGTPGVSTGSPRGLLHRGRGAGLEEGREGGREGGKLEFDPPTLSSPSLPPPFCSPLLAPPACPVGPFMTLSFHILYPVFR